MKILVLTSGGDAPGMNMILATLYKKFGKELYACRAGFKGLINNDIIPISEFEPLKFAKEAGSCIKCSRCPEFKTKEGFNKGLKNAQKFDVVIVLGGNGSYQGCCELSESGIRTVFIPATIDNDVIISDYSQGYHTAVKACVTTIENTMPTMDAFGRCCIFEIMGRDCSRITRCVSRNYPCDYVVLKKADVNYKKMAEAVRNKKELGQGSCIIVKERILKLQTIIENLQKIHPDMEYRGCVVGYVQRGTNPTSIDLDYARSYARLAINVILKTKYSAAIVYKKDDFDIIYRNEDGSFKSLRKNATKETIKKIITKHEEKTSI